MNVFFMYACMYVCICGTYMYIICSPCICVTSCLSVYVIVWTEDCPPLGFSARPPPGRRDSPGPGGRHRGEEHGKQIQDPL